ncbi:MAG: NAD(+) diphosphatase [Endozoicomonas sp. (ex Botrylloides leachii)]|nr:NAD(+) diphosphatase [Endozoicomonas sp. (ex Botrylloides leachii)]
MLGPLAFSGYQPLSGFNPQLKPECWLIHYKNDFILPEQHIVWLKKPDFLSVEEAEKALVTGLWQGRPIGILFTEENTQNNKTTTVRNVLINSGTNVFTMISHALEIATSRTAHRFCGRCGGKTLPLIGQWAMHCDICNHSVYPRISPCIIVLVTKNEELLLVKHKRHRFKKFYSLVAGFVEPGETAEEAVHREVMEEVGIQLSSVSYQLSQSWPFPHCLMLGFYAHYARGSIRLDDTELCAGDWFSSLALPELPPKNTISRQLIERYLRQTARSSKSE